LAPTPLVLVGCGGFARETAETVRAINATGAEPVWDLYGYVDDDSARWGEEYVGVSVIGGIDRIAELPDALVVVCPGHPGNFTSKRKLVERLQLPAERYATLIHPTAVVPLSCSVGAGTVILAGVVCTVDVEIGDHVGVMPQVVLTHDDRVDDFVIITAGVRLAGTVHVREGAYLGSGAVVRERLTIGEGALVGMGAVVTKDVPAGEVWIGSPARYQRHVEDETVRFPSSVVAES
jgi:sugar O-acyltransferase (sialic acid O-acetyltransferase NeuD family)